MMDIVAYDMATLGAHVERIPGRLGFGYMRMVQLRKFLVRG